MSLFSSLFRKKPATERVVEIKNGTAEFRYFPTSKAWTMRIGDEGIVIERSMALMALGATRVLQAERMQ